MHYKTEPSPGRKIFLQGQRGMLLNLSGYPILRI